MYTAKLFPYPQPVDPVQAFFGMRNAMNDLQNSNMGVQTNALNLQYLPQTIQAKLNNLNAQTGYTNAETGAVPSEIQQRLAQAANLQSDTLKTNALLQSGGYLPGMAGVVASLQALQRSGALPSGIPGTTMTAPGGVGAAVPAGSVTSSPLAGPGVGSVPFNPGQNPNTPLAPGQSMVPSIPLEAQASGLANPSTANGLAPGTPDASNHPQGPDGLAGQVLNGMLANYDRQTSQAKLNQVKTSPYFNLPPDQKNQVIAQANAFGYTPDEATQLLLNGKSLTDLAVAKGLPNDPSTWPAPNYAPTTANRTLYERRNSSLAELNTLNPIVTNALAPYAQRFAGYSPLQIAQAIKGDDPDAQAQYLAARALGPEISALRIKTAQGQVGIEAIREMQQAAMANFKAFQPLVTPQIYKASNDYMDKWLGIATDAANKVITTGKVPSIQNSGTQNTSQSSATLPGAKPGDPLGIL